MKAIVIYKATCQCCGMYYIGNTQQTLKNRMKKHYGEAREFAISGKKSDTFASHFGQHALEQKDPRDRDKKTTTDDIRRNVRMEVIWQGNAISCMKTFGQLSCKLCMQERIKIHEEMTLDKSRPMRKLINSGTEIPKFHRLALRNPSTDEALMQKKV